MLKKAQRFSRENFPKGKAVKRGTFPWGSVFVYNTPTFKGGVVVSKKAVKKAHERNRAKRRVYTALENFKDQNIGLLLRLRKEAITEDIKQITSDIKTVL